MSSTVESAEKNVLRNGQRRIAALLPQRTDFRAMTRSPRRDVVAGITVAFVALPLALAFGVASGAGAGAGLATAIVAGAVAAIFGGSNLQVSGPTGAMTVVLLPIVATVGISGVMVVGLLAGIILIALAFLRAGRFMQYIPLPVIEGFTVGIAVIIGLQQIPAALGQSPTDEKIALRAWSSVISFFENPNWAAFAVAGVVVAAMLLAPLVKPGFPVSLPALILATVLATWLGLSLATIGALPETLGTFGLPTVAWNELSSLVIPAVAVAALAALESLMSATVADGMSIGERHDPDRELFGQGLANVAAPLFGGVPATAAIARTAVNVRSGARSRLAALTQSGALLLIVLLASRWVSYVPLAALAGVLIATAIRMVEVSNIRAILRATPGDAVVLVTTAIATIALDLVTAVIIGMLIAGFYALRQVAKSTRVNEIPMSSSDNTEEELALLKEHVIAYRLDGPLFFGAAHQFLLEISEVNDVRVVILRLARITTLDATGASVLGDTIERLEERGVTVLLSGIDAAHENVFESIGVYEQLASEHHVFDATPEAINFAKRLIAEPTQHPEHR